MRVTLVKIPHCWNSHVEAQLRYLVWYTCESKVKSFSKIKTHSSNLKILRNFIYLKQIKGSQEFFRKKKQTQISKPTFRSYINIVFTFFFIYFEDINQGLTLKIN